MGESYNLTIFSTCGNRLYLHHRTLNIVVYLDFSKAFATVSHRDMLIMGSHYADGSTFTSQIGHTSLNLLEESLPLSCSVWCSPVFPSWGLSIHWIYELVCQQFGCSVSYVCWWRQSLHFDTLVRLFWIGSRVASWRQRFRVVKPVWRWMLLSAWCCPSIDILRLLFIIYFIWLHSRRIGAWVQIHNPGFRNNTMFQPPSWLSYQCHN